MSHYVMDKMFTSESEASEMTDDLSARIFSIIDVLTDIDDFSELFR
jgi:hypothetical protein